MNNALIIFVRNPELGKVKTRLAASIGDTKTLDIYTYLLQHTYEVADSIYADKFIFYTDAINENDLWNDYYKLVQSNGDLGERMEKAFQFVFNLGYTSACIIGSDCLDLNKEILNQAFSNLKNNDVVIGPAADGGYYLLGMNTVENPLFENKKWSTNSVFESTINDCKNKNLTYHLLETLTDIDTEDDLKKYSQLQQLL
jgi:uncharacterized protein